MLTALANKQILMRQVSTERLFGIRTVHSFGMEEQEYLRYCDAVDASFSLARKIGLAEGLFLGGGFLVSQGTLLGGMSTKAFSYSLGRNSFLRRTERTFACNALTLREPEGPHLVCVNTNAVLDGSYQPGPPSRGKGYVQPGSFPISDSPHVCLHTMCLGARGEKGGGG